MHRVIVSLILVLFAACLSADDQIPAITVDALHARIEAKEAVPLIVDVREPDEFEAGHIDGAMLAPLGTVEDGLASIPKDREIALICRSGRRSALALQRLAAHGYTKLWNVTGGMLAWEEAGFPVVKK